MNKNVIWKFADQTNSSQQYNIKEQMKKKIEHV